MILFVKELWTAFVLIILSALSLGLILLPLMFIAEMCNFIIFRVYKMKKPSEYKNFSDVKRGGEK
jgi:hypothetical protein